MKSYLIEGLAPLVFGEGKPFGVSAGSQRIVGLDMPLPSTLAGALRSCQARAWFNDGQLSQDQIARLLKSEVQGPLLAQRLSPREPMHLLFASPADAAVLQVGEKAKLFRSLPDKSQCLSGANYPDGLYPTRIKGKGEPTKQSRAAVWGLDHMTAWLSGTNDQLDLPVWKPLPREERTHVAIDSSKRVAEDQMLFSTNGVWIGPALGSSGQSGVEELRDCALACRVVDELHVDSLLTLGGERRLVRLKQDEVHGWQCPEQVRQALRSSGGLVKMILATPAVFIEGFKPGWTEIHGVRMRLVSACCGRPLQVSGWDLVKRAPKPIRYAAPAGSVFFFELEDASQAGSLADHWLEAVSDDEQHRRDGFGLAMWGKWDWYKEN